MTEVADYHYYSYKWESLNFITRLGSDGSTLASKFLKSCDVLLFSCWSALFFFFLRFLLLFAGHIRRPITWGESTALHLEHCGQMACILTTKPPGCFRLLILASTDSHCCQEWWKLPPADCIRRSRLMLVPQVIWWPKIFLRGVVWLMGLQIPRHWLV